MLMLIFILHAISASLCYDIELEGVLKVGQNFLESLNQHSEFSKKLNLPALQFASKGKLPKKALGEAVMRAILQPNANRKTNTAETLNKTQATKPYSLQDYVDHLKKKGKRSLKYIGKLILRQINLDKNITLLLKVVTDDYVMMIQNYHDFVTERLNKDEPPVSKELVYLDMVETACRLLYSEERKLFNEIIKGLNASFLNDTVRIMNEKIFRYSVNEKKHEIGYICDTYKVCRKYPAFTDYCADLLSEILKLPEEKFGKFLNILANIVVSNDAFLSTLAEKEDKDTMASILSTFSDNLNSMREFLAVVRSVVTQRFKTVHTGNEKLKKRTKAMRILLDIIDKSLSIEDELLAMDFETTVSALRNWSGGLRKNIDDIFHEISKHLLRIMEYNLTKNAKKEMKVLIEVVLRGNTSNEEFYEHMVKFGSRYINDDEFEASLDMV